MKHPAKVLVLACATVLTGCRGEHGDSRIPRQLPRPTSSESGVGVSLSVAAATTTFASSDEVRFWVTLQNPRQSGCRPLFLDPQPIAETPRGPLAPRPQTVITLSIRTADGAEVKPRSLGGEKSSVLRAHELVLLHCGHGYAWEVWPGRAPWGYVLAAGEYTAEVAVTVPVASFFGMHDGLEARVMELWEPAGEAAKTYIRDVATKPAKITFVVAEG